ncbi:hypothetical protein BPY_01060 [Bifidobacterium psychraerophilum]
MFSDIDVIDMFATLQRAGIFRNKGIHDPRIRHFAGRCQATEVAPGSDTPGHRIPVPAYEAGLGEAA